MSKDYHFSVKIERPEEKFKSAIDYFKGAILDDYANSKNIMRIQQRITVRALELLEPKKNGLILDAGAGPGFAAFYLKEAGYNLVCIDLIPDFFNYYDMRDLNPIAADMCFPPFRSTQFDGIISVSALQWVFKEPIDDPMRKRLISLAQSFETILKSNSRIIFQFYPKNDIILKEIGKIFIDCTKLEGNFVIDNPKNPKKREIFLSLRKS